MKQPLGDLCQIARFRHGTQIAQLRHGQTAVTTGIDGGIGSQIHIDIETQAVIAARVADAQTQCGNLGLIDLDPGRAALAAGDDAITRQQIDQRLFDAAHEFAHLDAAPGKIDQ